MTFRILLKKIGTSDLLKSEAGLLLRLFLGGGGVGGGGGGAHSRHLLVNGTV